jgi:YggT family protein
METTSIANILWNLIEIVFWVYLIMLFVRILSSWIPELQGTKILQFVSFYTDPYLNIFRRFIPPIGMIDISPIVAFLCLGFIEHALKWLVITIFG